MITGISGGEFGVRGYVAAYDINTGKQVWKAFSTGPDAEMLVDPDKTMTWTDGKMAPVGKDSSLKTWQGDQWKIGGGTTWGWYSYDPKLNLMYYGTGNPSTWNPVPASGRQQVVDDHLRARRRHRQGEVGLPDDAARRVGLRRRQRDDPRRRIKREGQAAQRRSSTSTATALPTRWIASPASCWSREKYDPTVNWATHVDMKTGRPQVVKQVQHRRRRART